MSIHGVESTILDKSPVTVTQIPSGIVAISGIAPKGPINQLMKIDNPAQAAQFGLQVPGFTLPQALETHFGEGGQTVYAINVFDPATHTTAVTSESITMVGGKGKTAYPPISNFVLKNSGGTITYVKGTDYTLDDYGHIVSLDYTKIAADATVSASYSKQDLSAITSAEIIGTVASSGARTGMKAFEKSLNLYGAEPKIFIAPGFSELAAVATELRYWAKRMEGVCIVDAPANTTVATALTSRGPAGTIGFNVPDENTIYVFPRLKSYDPATDSQLAKPHSQFLGGLMARVDAEYGYQYSPSNKPYRTATGTDVEITSSMLNPDNDAQNLNKIGIVTVYSEGTSGLKSFGNRNSAYPASAAITTFISVKREIDIDTRSIKMSTIPYVDLPMSSVLRDSIRDGGNNFLRARIGAGGLIDAEMIFDPAKNPSSQLATGRWVFTILGCPAPPAESTMFEWYVDIDMLSTLTENL